MKNCVKCGTMVSEQTDISYQELMREVFSLSNEEQAELLEFIKGGCKRDYE